MKKYTVIIEPKAQKQLKKIDPIQSKMIQKWILKNLVNCSEPCFQGKMLKGNLKNIWRYRVGQYRIFAEIDREFIVIKIIKIGHRQSVYND